MLNPQEPFSPEEVIVQEHNEGSSPLTEVCIKCPPLTPHTRPEGEKKLGSCDVLIQLLWLFCVFLFSSFTYCKGKK